MRGVGQVAYFTPRTSHAQLIISLLADGKTTRLINPGCTASLCYLVIYCALSHVSRHKPGSWGQVGKWSEAPRDLVRELSNWRCGETLHNSNCQIWSVYKAYKTIFLIPSCILEAYRSAKTKDRVKKSTWFLTFKHESCVAFKHKDLLTSTAWFD